MLQQIISLFSEGVRKTSGRYAESQIHTRTVEDLILKMDSLEERIESNESEIKKIQNHIILTKIENLKNIRKNGIRNAKYGPRISAKENEVDQIQNQLFW